MEVRTESPQTPALGLVDLRSWDIVTMRGSDHKSFMSGLITNEIKKLQPGDTNSSLLLTAKGRIQREVQVSCLPEETLLLTSPNEGPEVYKFLDFYHVMEDLSMSTDPSAWAPLLLLGTELAAWCGQRATPWNWPEPGKGAAISWAAAGTSGDVWLQQTTRLGTLPAALLWVPRDQVDACLAQLQEDGLPLMDEKAWAEQRMWHGWLEASTMLSDLLVHEAGLQESHVSYTKGCFVGQEVVARTQHRGRPTKGVFIVHTEQGLPASEEGLVLVDADGKDQGKILGECPLPSGGVGHQALIKLKAIEAETALFVDGDTPLRRIAIG